MNIGLFWEEFKWRAEMQGFLRGKFVTQRQHRDTQRNTFCISPRASVLPLRFSVLILTRMLYLPRINRLAIRPYHRIHKIDHRTQQCLGDV